MPTSDAPSEEFVQAMHDRLEELTGQMDRFTRTSDELVSRTQQLMRGLNETSARVGTELSTSISSVSGTVDRLGTELTGVSHSLAQTMGGLSERVSATEEDVRARLAELRQAIESGHARSVGTEQAMQELASSISDFGRRLEDLQASQAALAPVLSQLAGPLELRILPTSGGELRGRLRLPAQERRPLPAHDEPQALGCSATPQREDLALRHR